VLPYEIGNALSSLLRRKVLSVEQLPAAWDAVQSIPVELLSIDVRSSLDLAARFGLYAYDAYFLQCAASERCPLLSLDKRVKSVAPELGIRILE
jgi:predicted nucleic acid-binding protein